jgi:hypothetical protein
LIFWQKLYFLFLAKSDILTKVDIVTKVNIFAKADIFAKVNIWLKQKVYKHEWQEKHAQFETVGRRGGGRTRRRSFVAPRPDATLSHLVKTDT